MLQIQAALTETCSPSNGVHEREKRPKIFNRTRRSAFAAIFVAGAMPIFFLGIPAVKDIQNQVYSADKNPLARISVMQTLASDRAEIGLRLQDESSINTAGGLANESTEPTPTESDAHASASNPNGAKSAPVADRADVQALLEPTKTSPHLSKKWSVQISAAPAKDIADTLAHRLNANGFDGYVVQVDVKGQTYYRVRVGHFDARDEAESVRRSLARQERYRDAYLTFD